MRKGIFAAIFIGLALTLSGCGVYGYEPDLSSVNETSFGLWRGAWLAAAVVGIFTAILILWPAIFHRRKAGDAQYPKQSQYNIPIEVAYTIIPFIIVAVLFAYTAKSQSEITSKRPDKVMHEIGVNAIQWSWQFSYPEAGENATVTGTPSQPPVLYMPQGERVRFSITSNDVVHGFWIPAFMIQMQNIPGVTNHLEFTAKKLGEYPGRCNILCGRSHSQMLFKVKVVTPTEYQDYINNLKASA